MTAMCRHLKPNLITCTLYACLLSSFFVLNLYLFVPSRIQQLERSDVRQIKWRTLSVLITSIVTLISYPLIFCEEWILVDKIMLWNKDSLLYVIRHMWGLERMNQAITFLPCLHATILYSGSIVTSFLEDYILYLRLKDRHYPHKQDDKIGLIKGTIKRRKQIIKETFPNGWQSTRDFIFAPFTEEFIFRVCMISPFLYNGQWSIIKISWIVPMFFGLAHVHHAITKLRDGMPVKGVVIVTMLQLSYTTLFGAYASYIYIKTGSLFAIALVHSFCNFMGLPNLFPFVIQKYVGSKRVQKMILMCRILSAGVYAVGIYSFVIMFDASTGLFKDCKPWW